jgi:hypothetical protein
MREKAWPAARSETAARRRQGVRERWDGCERWERDGEREGWSEGGI